MAKSVDLDKIKNKASELSSSWKKKFGHLSQSVSRSGMEGVQHWLKTHHQVEEFEEACDDLKKASLDDDFQLVQVYTTFSSFVLPEEDIGQAEWYKTAHDQIDKLANTLSNENRVDTKLLQSILKELKFISEAEDFHSRYQIEEIQQKVTQLYQSLQKSLTEFKALEKEKLSASKEAEATKQAELEAKKAEALSKKAMMENVKIKEKRLAIMEEKKRRVAEKEAFEAQQKLQLEEAEIQTKKAEADRQAKLQDAYVDLQIEERISKWELTELIDMLRERLNNESLEDSQKQTLTAFVDFANEKFN